MMKIYLAPLEGITGWIYRSAVHECFGGFDKYFVPFIRPNQMGHLSSREKKDILPANNTGMRVVPQILTNRSEDFLRTAEKLKEYGYEEVNLNLGCPSKTVVTKRRGAGFLAEPKRLEVFLDEIFGKCSIRISVKTRLGMEEAGEFSRLLDIYNKYPMEELIIHPRVQKDFYKTRPILKRLPRLFLRAGIQCATMAILPPYQMRTSWKRGFQMRTVSWRAGAFLRTQLWQGRSAAEEEQIRRSCASFMTCCTRDIAKKCPGTGRFCTK